MTSHSYPSIEDVLSVQEYLIARFGGSFGLRDRGALESALARPQCGYYADPIEEAAALLESLSQNHPFIDGNKRTAISIATAFLRMNGYQLVLDDLAAYQLIIRLYETGQFRFSVLERWLRENTKPAVSDQ